MIDVVSTVMDEIEKWYESKRAKTGRINTNVMTVGIVISGMISDGLPIDTESVATASEGQVRGMSGAAIETVLRSKGETRNFTAEGGRTSRGSLKLARELVEVINRSTAKTPITLSEAQKIAEESKSFFVRAIQVDYFNKQRLKPAIDPMKPVSHLVAEILATADSRDDYVTGVVLQHLVGAKLQLRFPQIPIGRDKAHSADMQTERHGDFEIGSTVFHVTVSPMTRLIDRCRVNIHAELRPVVIVPQNKSAAAQQLADIAGIGDRVNVIDAENFVGSNIEEQSLYGQEQIRQGIAKLIGSYNERIETIEADQSLRIETPSWLDKLADQA